MGIKLHSGRRKVFRKKKLLPRVLLGIVVSAAVIGLGFFGAKWVTEHPAPKPADISDQEPEAPSADSGIGETSEDVSRPATESTGDWRAFQLPVSALKKTGSLAETCEKAAKAGFNAVVFTLKDQEGSLAYASATEVAEKVNAVSASAISLEDLTEAFGVMRDAGLTPIPRLYAFRDNLAARALETARIAPAGNPTWVWYDNDPKAGGKAWLNPYADEAQYYLIRLAAELKKAGAGAVMFSGVQFPAHCDSADFGQSANTSMSRGEILSHFIEKAQKSLGSDCPVILTASCNGVLGNDTVTYGDNPLDLSADRVAPLLTAAELPEKIKLTESTITDVTADPAASMEAILNQMMLRTKVISAAKRPLLMPMLEAGDRSDQQIREAIAGCRKAGVTSYILCAADGRYNFDSLG